MRDTSLIEYHFSNSSNIYASFIEVYKCGPGYMSFNDFSWRGVVLSEFDHEFLVTSPFFPLIIETVILHAGYQWVKYNAES